MSEHALIVRDGIVDDRDQIEAMQDTIARLRRELAAERQERARDKAASSRALSALRTQLTPLYRALQGVFGKMESAGIEDGSAPLPDSRTGAIWQSWKTRLGPQCGKIIDALLLQPDMNTTQLAIAIGTHRNNITNLIFKLNKAGLLNKSGGRFSLKSL